MIPSEDAPLRVVALSIVADVSPTALRDEARLDTATVTATAVLEEPTPDLVLPVRADANRRTTVTVNRAGLVARFVSEVTVAPDDEGNYRLEVHAPDVPELIHVVDGSPVDVIVVLPSAPIVLVDWSREKPATIYGTDHVDERADERDSLEHREPIAGRVAVAWRFDRDPTLDVVWRYVDTGGSPNK